MRRVTSTLIINSLSITIDQPSRLLSSVFLDSESSIKQTELNLVEEQKTFLMKVKENASFVLNGLEIISDGKHYHFDGLRIKAWQWVVEAFWRLMEGG